MGCLSLDVNNFCIGISYSLASTIVASRQLINLWDFIVLNVILWHSVNVVVLILSQCMVCNVLYKELEYRIISLLHYHHAYKANLPVHYGSLWSCYHLPAITPEYRRKPSQTLIELYTAHHRAFWIFVFIPEKIYIAHFIMSKTWKKLHRVILLWACRCVGVSISLCLLYVLNHES